MRQDLASRSAVSPDRRALGPVPLSRLELASIALALAALTLGLYSFLSGPDPQTQSPQAAILRTLQLFVLQLGPADLHGWAGWVAVFAAPVAAVLGAGSLLDRLVKAAMAKPRPPNRTRVTDLFLGGGRMASEIALSQLAARPGTVVQCLDVNPACELGAVQHPGVLPLLVGSAAVADELLRAGVDRAERVWVTCGSDEQQLRVLSVMAKLPAATLRPGQKWLVDMESRTMVHTAELMFGATGQAAGTGQGQAAAPASINGLTRVQQRPDIRYFNQERLAVRRLFREHGPRIDPGAAAPLHVAVLGTGAVAQAIVLQAIRHLVTDPRPDRAVRITWFGLHAEREWRTLRQVYPVLGDPTLQGASLRDLLPLAHVRTVDCDETTMPLGDWERARADGPFAVVYAAAQDSLKTALAARQAVRLQWAGSGTDRHVPVIACFPDARPIEGSDEHAVEIEASRSTPFEVFWVFESVLQDRENYPGEQQDELSGIPQHKRGDTEWRMWSRRSSCDHLSLVAGPLKRSARFNDARIAEIEHRRYVVERLLEGWLPAGPDARAALGDQGCKDLHLHWELTPMPATHAEFWKQYPKSASEAAIAERQP